MDYKAIIQALSEHIERVDYREERGELRRYRLDRARVRSENGTPVGDVSVWGKGTPVKIKLNPYAPCYLKPLEDEEFKSVPLLVGAVRREAFRHEAKKVFRNYLLADMKQLEDDG